MASPLPPTPGKIFRRRSIETCRLPREVHRNTVAEVFRRLPGELLETPRRAFRSRGGGREVFSEEGMEEAREEVREDVKEEAGRWPG